MFEHVAFRLGSHAGRHRQGHEHGGPHVLIHAREALRRHADYSKLDAAQSHLPPDERGIRA
jgi:hypothetical protein